MTTLSPVAKQQFFDNNGRPLVGGLLFVYEAGTTTKTTSYSNEGGTVNSNPIVLDYRGECNLWLEPNLAYKFVLSPSTDTDPPTAPIWTVDEIRASSLLTLWAGVDVGVVNAYVLTFVASFSSYANGIVLYWVPSVANTGASTVNVNGIGAVDILQSDGSALEAGMLKAGGIPYSMVYYNGDFYLQQQSVITDGSFTGTLTGMTGSTTGSVSYRIVNDTPGIGRLCTLYVSPGITGTSNTTAMTMTGLPAACQPTGSRTPLCSLKDNSTDVLGYAFLQNGSGTITFAVDQPFSQTGFTNSGAKGFSDGWTITYTL